MVNISWKSTDEKNAQTSKYSPIVEEVDLLECNPQYAFIKMPDGRETTVSIRQLAPAGEKADMIIELSQ